MKKILYVSAKKSNGQLVLAKDAERGEDFYCAMCGAEMILRKSGKYEKGSKRPHFAHKALTSNCTAESVLHYSFKYLLKEYINKNIEYSRPISFKWKCKYCGGIHTGNLIKKANIAKEEYNLSVCKPDIVLLDENKAVYAAIEIVVTHKPEFRTIQYYKKNSIILIQINVKTDEDLINFKEKLSNPDIVNFCTLPKCPKCGRFRESKYLTIIEGDCYRCKKKMKVATIYTSNGSLHNLRPSDFTKEEINIAISKGVKLEVNHSQTMKSKYVSNTCPNCNAFVGNHYLFVDYISPAGSGQIPSIDYNIGFYCKMCDRRSVN